MRAFARTLLGIATAAALFGLAVSPAEAGGCQNQLAIDACKAGCTATSAACGALCGGAIEVCANACTGGCSAGCATQCCFGTCPNRGRCERCVGNCRDDCRDDCQLDCDDCIFDCKEDCESICIPFREAGEACIPIIDRCDEDLVCWPIPTPGDDRTRCFPSEGDAGFSNEECRGFYSSGRHKSAIDDETTTTYGRGTALAVGAGFTVERGAVYGRDGRYGCFVTECVGVTADAELGVFASIGVYGPYDSVAGQSVSTVSEASAGFGGTSAVITDTSLNPIGSAFCAAIEFSAQPIALGIYDCATKVNTVGLRQSDGSLAPIDNRPPVARCTDVTSCADPARCTADASVDAGSNDPDLESVTLTQQPPAPYALGEHRVTLTATDPDGATDRCEAQVVVEDCSPPETTHLLAEPAQLWPPNHRMLPVEIDARAHDACDGAVVCPVTDVASDEPRRRSNKARGKGRQEQTPEIDVEILGPRQLRLRAERLGAGEGRVYRVAVECSDGAGNSAHAEIPVSVAHDRGSNGR